MDTAPRSRAFLENAQAGLTTAVVLIPQGMAYATVAGLPPIHGLYASLLPLLAYALLGRSRQLAVGPGALDSLLVGAGLSAQAFVTDENRAGFAAALALMVGGLQLGLALLRAGFLVNFLSRPVVSGFTSGAAVLIAGSQLPALLGMEGRPGPRLHEQLVSLYAHVGSLSPATALVGLGSVAALFGLGRLNKSLAPLLVVGLSIAASALFDLSAHGVAVVGALPRGLPALALPTIGLEEARALLPTALTAAGVGYLTVISIAQTFANQRGEVLSPNRELSATAAVNFAAGLSQGFPVSASFSRSAVHARAGASSRFAALGVVACVALSIFALTDLFALLPRATLAAVIVTAVAGLVDLRAPRRLAAVKRADMWLLLFTLTATLFMGPEAGVLLGVAASLGLLIFRTTRPHAAVLGRLPGTTDYRNAQNYPGAELTPGVLVLRIDSQFYFGNVSFLQTLLRDLEREAKEPLRAVVLDASALNQLDSSANDALEQIVADYAERGVCFAMANVKEPVGRVMRASGLCERVGRENIHMNVHAAVQAVSGAARES